MTDFAYHVAHHEPGPNRNALVEIDRAQARDLCRRLDFFGRGLLEDLERTAIARGSATYEGTNFDLQVQQVLHDD